MVFFFFSLCIGDFNFKSDLSLCKQKPLKMAKLNLRVANYLKEGMSKGLPVGGEKEKL